MSEEVNTRGEGPDKRFVLAGTFLVVVLIAGIVMTVMGLIGGDEKTSEPSRGQAPTITVDSEATVESCELAHDRSEEPSERMAAWPSTWRGMRIAVSDEYGPCDLSGVPAGYAKSPIGATLAALNFVALVNNSDEPRAVGELYLAEVPEKAGLLDQVGEPAEGRLSIDGFKYLGSTGDVAGVQVAASGPGTEVVSVDLVMVWQDGDWKVDPVGEGQLWQMEPVGSHDQLRLDGWTVWGF